MTSIVFILFVILSIVGTPCGGTNVVFCKNTKIINEKSRLATKAESCNFLFLENKLNTNSPVDNGQTSTKFSLHLFSVMGSIS